MPMPRNLALAGKSLQRFTVPKLPESSTLRLSRVMSIILVISAAVFFLYAFSVYVENNSMGLGVVVLPALFLYGIHLIYACWYRKGIIKSGLDLEELLGPQLGRKIYFGCGVILVLLSSYALLAI